MTSRNGNKDWVYILIGFVPTMYILTSLNYSFDIIGGVMEHLRGDHRVDLDKIDYKLEMTKLNNGKVRADDKILVEIIKRFYIEPPSTLPYSLKYPEVEDPSLGQAAVVDRALNYLKGGFFIECGAHDGEFISNTLYFERYRNWTGILIEASPSKYKQLKEKHRKAYTLQACLSLTSSPSKVLFGKENILDGDATNYTKENSTVAQCFPLHSILLALNRLRIDYFSLDVEGSEKAILDTIPWNKLEIKMLSIEYNAWTGGKSSLKRYMRERGYMYVSEVFEHFAADLLFIKQ